MKTIFDVTASLQSTGTTQSDATSLSTDCCVITSTTGNGSGVILPSDAKSGEIFVVIGACDGSQNIYIYPPSGGSFLPGNFAGASPSVNAPVSMGSNVTVAVVCIGSGIFAAAPWL